MSDFEATAAMNINPTAPVPFSLLPDSSEVDENGELTIGGCNIAEIAAEYGTPVFVYDEQHLRSRCREAVASFGSEVAYAGKAFLCIAMAKLVNEEGMCLDVASAGELYTAIRAGVPGNRIVFHGNNKSVRELQMAREFGVGRIVVDSDDEIDRLESLHSEDGRVVPVLLRVTPGVRAETHEFISTGQEDSKFGFGIKSGAASAAVDRANASNAVNLVGIHSHIGSQVFRIESFDKALVAVSDFFKALDLPELSIGGGLGVAYVENDIAASISEWGAQTKDTCARLGISDVRILAEPGRAIAAQAAITVYTIGTFKSLPGIRNYVAVDGGFVDNIRPVLYGSEYTSFAPQRVLETRPDSARIVGSHCESGDIIIREASLPQGLNVGDLIATPVTGAYGHGMGSNYNRMGRPPVVFVSNGEARLVVRGEMLEDLLRLDIE
jgi:diaminopimelate decarboxylase|tara:strand:- start:12804 stop:14120 length:1317 start_codon:yes stop_codon:yes gene_type:complete